MTGTQMKAATNSSRNCVIIVVIEEGKSMLFISTVTL